MTVRLAFSVIVHVDAEVLVIDEALSVGDVFFTQKCMRFLRDFMTRGTVLFVSHDTGAVVNLCNQAILLDRGHIVDIGEPKAVTKYYLTDTHGHYKKDSESDLTPIAFSDANSAPEPLVRDMREELLRQSKFRNDIEIFEFQPDHSGFGAGGAEIVSVELLDEDGARLTWVIGGEDVVLRIRCQARTKLCSPIIGFDFRDRLGQVLFGENTYLSYQEKPVELDTGEITVATFAFRLPLLPTGDYSITAAIAEGCQEKHVQQHWMHEALILKVHASSIRFGLVGLPMDKILLSKPL